MISRTTDRFRKAFAELPKQVQHQTKEAYKQFKKDPYYPSLRFKRIHSTEPVYFVRINIEYRAIGIQKDGEIIWFWICLHDNYIKLLDRLG